MTEPKCGTCGGSDGDIARIGNGPADFSHVFKEKCIAELLRQLAELQRVIEVAREALVPFTMIPVERFSGGNGPGGEPEDVFIQWNLGTGDIALSVRNVLAARAVLASMPPKPETKGA